MLLLSVRTREEGGIGESERGATLKLPSLDFNGAGNVRDKLVEQDGVIEEEFSRWRELRNGKGFMEFISFLSF